MAGDDGRIEAAGQQGSGLAEPGERARNPFSQQILRCLDVVLVPGQAHLRKRQRVIGPHPALAIAAGGDDHSGLQGFDAFIPAPLGIVGSGMELHRQAILVEFDWQAQREQRPGYAGRSNPEG